MSKFLKVFCLLLCLAMIFALAVSLTACKKEKPQDTPAAPASEEPKDNENLSQGHTHVFDKKVTTATYKVSDATCRQKARYYFSCECGEQGTEIFESGDLAAHRYKNGVCEVCLALEDHVHTLTHHDPVAKTCTTPGNIEYWSCDCNTYFSDAEGKNEITLAATVVPASHNLKPTETIAVASCTTKGKTRTECNDCDYVNEVETPAEGHAWDHDRTCTQGHTCTVCAATEPALGHDYSIVETTDYTCTENGFTTHTCSRCGDHYDDEIVAAPGHSVPDEGEGAYAFVSSEKKHEAGLCRVDHYEGKCSECGKTVTKDTAITEHHFVKTITKAATCQAEGEYTYTCQDCGFVKTEAFTDANAHAWDEGETVGNVKTFHCTHTGCTATKTAVVATTEATVTNDQLQNSDEIALNAATIQLDQDTKDALGTDVTISAGVATQDAIDALALSPEDQEMIAGEKVYEFGATSDGNAINADNKFGGKVTVRIPYELEEGEDPDSIVIFWIDGDNLVAQDARYENGFAVFETDHFSYYTVTRMTPAERCARFGHNEKEIRVAPTCTSDGYVTVVCTRCGLVVSKEFLLATGHNYKETVTPATCTVAGSVLHTCSVCTHSYTTSIAALGHDWQESNRQEASCTAAGYVVYTCAHEGCDESYTATLLQKSHNFTAVVTPATCTLGGYTTYTCPDCHYTYRGDEKAALGHRYAETVHAPTCTEDGYTEHICVRCQDAYRTSPVAAGHTWNIAAPTCGEGQICLICGAAGLPATGAHTMVNGVCSVCGQGCTHTFTEARVEPNCTENGYLAKTCTKCGVVEKSEYVPALGHNGDFICTRCHATTLPETYFATLAESILNGEVAFRLHNVKFNPVEKLGVEVEFAEASIGVNKDGELTGYGSGEIRLLTDGETKTFAATGYFEDGFVYLFYNGDDPTLDYDELFDFSSSQNKDENQKPEYGFVTNLVVNSAAGGSTQTTHAFYAKMDLGVLLSDMTPGGQANAVLELLPTVQTEVLPMLAKVLKADKGSYTNADMMVANYLFSVERKNGKATLTLDLAKLVALNDLLATKTLADIATDLYGAGAYDKFCNDLVTAVKNMTVGEAITMLKGYGIEVSDILDLMDIAAPFVTGKEGASAKDLLRMQKDPAEIFADPQVLALKVSTFLGMDDQTLAQQIASAQEMYASLKNQTVYDLLPGLIRMMQQMGGGNKVNPDQPENANVPGQYAGESGPDGKPSEYASDGKPFEEDGKDDGHEPVDQDGGDDAGNGNDAAPVSLHDRIAAILEQFGSAIGLKVTTTMDGAFLSLDITVDLPGMASGEVEILADNASATDYAAMVAEVNAKAAYFDVEKNRANIKDAVEKYLRNRYKYGDQFLSFAYDEETGIVTYVIDYTDSLYNEMMSGAKDGFDGKHSYYYREYGMPLDFDGETYYVRPLVKKIYTLDLGQSAGIMVADDCVNTWIVELMLTATSVMEMQVTVVAPNAETYEFEAVEDPSEELLAAATALFKDYFDRMSQNAGSDILNVTFLVNSATGTAKYISDSNPLDNAFSCHRYEFAYVAQASACDEYSHYHYYCTVCGKEFVKNVKLGHRDLEVQAEYANETDCEDGVTLTVTCRTCGKVLADHIFFEDGVAVPTSFVDLSEFGVCAHHMLMQYTCVDGCAKHSSGYTFNRNGMRYSWGNDSGCYYCPDCGLMLTEQYEGYEHANCAEYQLKKICVIMVNDVSLLQGDNVDLDNVFADEDNYTVVGEYQTREYQRAYHQKSMSDKYIDPTTGADIYYELCPDCGDAYVEIRTSVEERPCVYLETTVWYDGVFDVEHIPDRVEDPRALLSSPYFTLEDSDSESFERVDHDEDDLRVTAVQFLRGEDCESGVRVLLHCLHCGEDVTREYNGGHQLFVKEVYPLSDFGAVCEGNVIYRECACGKHSEVSVKPENTACDVNWHRYIGIEDGLVVDRCAVSDPEPCHFVVARQVVERRVGCEVYRDLIWMFGYDEETRTAEVTMTEKSAWPYRTEHEYRTLSTEQDNEGCYIYEVRHQVCAKCSQTHDEYAPIAENHDLEKIDECHAACRRCGRWIESHEYTELTVPATCSQPGLEKRYCVHCGDVWFEREIEPGHRYEYDYTLGKYVCTVCGLESTNWDGTVILEHCTDMDEETTVCVGYYVRDDRWDEFNVNFSLVLDPEKVEGDNVVSLDGVAYEFVEIEATETTPARHYVTFDAMSVVTVAGALDNFASLEEAITGVRLSFVPWGDSSTLDYGITFTLEDLAAIIPAE